MIRKSLDLGQPRNAKDRGAFMAQGGEDLCRDKTAKSTRPVRFDSLGQG